MKLRHRTYVRFPPRSGFLVLPRSPARAARAGLALYDTAYPRQRVALAFGDLLTRARLSLLLPRSERSDVDWGWWERWVAQVAEPTVGGVVGHVALRLPPHGQISALLMRPTGEPAAFVKLPRRPLHERAAAGWRLLSDAPLTLFRVPSVLAVGEFAQVRYHLIESLPEGVHRHPPLEPEKLWGVIDEFRAALATLERGAGTPAHHVPCHGDFHPRNLRVASDGSWWMFDLDKIKWGPRLADELRYWSAEVSWRRRRFVTRETPRVLALLRQRGSDEDIVEAVRWEGSRPKRPGQRDIYAAVEHAVTARTPRSR